MNIERPDLLDEKSPKGLRVVQLTADAGIPCAHVYMEAQVFSLDSKRFLLERSGNAHGPTANDPEHRYMLYDIDSGEMIPITDELNAVAPSFSVDGAWVYYLVDHGIDLNIDGGVELKRVRADGTGRETLAVFDTVVRGASATPRLVYPLSTISSDGKRLATGVFAGVDESDEAQWGIIRFDLEECEAEIVWTGVELRNSHPQYCRSPEAALSHDLMIQQNHGYRWSAATGEEVLRDADPLGPDIHVISDDGGNFRTLPWGRDGLEFCQGHQCWRGRTGWAITSTVTFYPQREDFERREARLIEGRPVTDTGHEGLNTPGRTRNDLTREYPDPHFHHFATDVTGNRFISDFWTPEPRELLYISELGKPGSEPARGFRYLMDSHSSNAKGTHSHPFLSPDGERAFFNSDESGLLQTYMIEGLVW